MLIMMAGLPGSGKSTLSQALAQRCGGVVLDKDSIRAALFPPDRIEYSHEQDDFCQQLMLATAEYLLSRDPRLRIFLDGRPFSRRYQREQVEAAAARLHAPLAIIECVCSDALALTRLQRDDQTGTHPAANRKPGLYAQLKAKFEPLTEPRITIQTNQSLTECVRQAEVYLDLISQTWSRQQS
ncbi:MAG TPA: ATP-binding protein [Terriglobales bacterium]|nr:ATP-binding protein [Terriglobales bacterium]